MQGPTLTGGHFFLVTYLINCHLFSSLYLPQAGTARTVPARMNVLISTLQVSSLRSISDQMDLMTWWWPSLPLFRLFSALFFLWKGHHYFYFLATAEASFLAEEERGDKLHPRIWHSYSYSIQPIDVNQAFKSWMFVRSRRVKKLFWNTR